MTAITAVGGVPYADDLYPAFLPIRQDVVLAEALGPGMDWANVLAVRLGNRIYPVDRHVDPKHASDHGLVLRLTLLG